MIIITRPLSLWSGEGGNWHFVTIPADEAVEIRLQAAAAGPRRGFGSVRVEARTGEVTWRTSIFPTKNGDYLLPIKADLRRRAGIAAGDEVRFTIDLIGA